MKHICLFCKKEFEGRKLRKYCSNKCQGLYSQEQKIISGKAGEKCIKRYLLRTQENKCNICNLSIWLEQKIPLVLDHKDGNSENNKLINCRLICNNCDALTPTYKNRNKGNGRYYRRLRYKQGKSY
jgi:hypothetical protein